MNEKTLRKRKVLISIMIAAILLVAIILMFSLKRIPVGNIGIEVSLSSVTGKTYDSGWYFLTSFKIKGVKMSIQKEVIEYPTPHKQNSVAKK